MRSSGARVFYTFIQKAHSIGFGQPGAPQRALDQRQPPQERRLRGPFGVLQQASLALIPGEPASKPSEILIEL